MRRVLIISYFFPPMGMGGVHRTLKFAKYLPLFGWEPIILTVRDVHYYAYDLTLLQEVNGKVFRSESLDPFRVAKRLGLKPSLESGRKNSKPFFDFFLFPDSRAMWAPFAFSLGCKIIEDFRPEVIFSTSPPPSSHIVGYFLKKRSGLPLILDFRDAWGFGQHSTSIHRRISQRLEGRIVREADMILAINEPILEDIFSAYESGRKDKFSVIELGYDPEDFEEISEAKSQKFCIVYMGTFIGKRSPESLILAVEKLIERHFDIRDKIDVILVGTVREEDRRMIENSKISNCITIIPYLSHKESLSYLFRASVLWMVIGDDEDRTISTGKIYEYLASRKPILLSAPECNATALVRSISAGVVIAPGNIEELANEIYKFFILYEEGKIPRLEQEKISKFDRRRLTEKLATCLSKVVSKK